MSATEETTGLNTAELLFASNVQRCVTILVTPNIAKDWIENRNTRNVGIKPNKVRYLSRQMSSGRWLTTVQGISFDIDGVLMDGQHRLLAIIHSGCSLVVRIFLNEPKESMEVMDTGVPRNNADIITLTGSIGVIVQADLGVLRCMMFMNSKIRKSPGEDADLLGVHLKAIRWAREHIRRCDTQNVGTALMRGVIARAYYSVDIKVLEAFCASLMSGVSQPRDCRAVPLLSTYLFSMASAGSGGLVKRQSYLKIERALCAYITRENISSLRVASREMFPIPGEEREGDGASPVVA